MKNVKNFSTGLFLALMLFSVHTSFGQDQNVQSKNLAAPPPAKVLGMADNNIETVSYSLFPNPCSEKLTVELNHVDVLPGTEVNIYSLTGKKVWSGILAQKVVIDVSKLNRGIYIINCNGASYKFQKV